MLSVGSLFSGIGGIDKGLEDTGRFQVRWQVEIDPWCRRVLEKHWPAVTRYDDVRTFLDDEPERVDVLAGGFPCQPIANCGKRLAQADHRWLWPAFADAIRHLRPRIVLVENVAALRSRGLDCVLGDLAASGFDGEWDCIPASAVGANHQRDRLWLVAYPHRARSSERQERLVLVQQPATERDGWWAVEPAIRRVVDGLPRELDRVARVRGLGNAVVPQVVTWLGHQIADAVDAGRI